MLKHLISNASSWMSAFGSHPLGEGAGLCAAVILIPLDINCMDHVVKKQNTLPQTNGSLTAADT